MPGNETDSSLPSIVVTLLRNQAIVFTTVTAQNFELGRRQADEPADPCFYQTARGVMRLVSAAIDLRAFPRQLLRVEIVDAKTIRIFNIHEQAIIRVMDHPAIAPKSDVVLSLPLVLQLPENFVLKVLPAPVVSKTLPEMDEDWSQALQSISISTPRQQPGSALRLGSSLNLNSSWRDPSNRSLTQMAFDPQGESVDPTSGVLSWLEYALAAMQRPASSVEFYSGIVQAVAQIIEVDRAEVILWDGKAWERDAKRTFIRPEIDPASIQEPSSTMLHQARVTRQMTIYPDNTLGSDVNLRDSLRSLNAAVACPILDIFGGGEDILGVLYADRRIGRNPLAQEVNEAEQKLIAILATAIASSVAKTNREKLVSKYQQFFSPKVTEAIRRNPALLAGEDASISVLFCDIRGFSRETDRIGPAKAMEWVSDTLSELSEEVLQTDGVLVDYVGDELFAMWGAPEKTDDHAMRAVLTAQRMMLCRPRLSERYRETLPNGVDFGIGICTGPARVGNTGSKQKFKYGPLGHTVNLGSRIQGLTKQWKVGCMIDAVTNRNLPSTVLRRRLCKAEVVGMHGSIDLYELMFSNDAFHRELAEQYEAALNQFESGTQAREAARAFGALVQQYPTDGPSLVMLVRAVNEVVEPSQPFNPVWVAKSK